MQRRQYLAAAGTAIALPIAGCSAPSEPSATPAPQQVGVSFRNDGDRTLVFTAAVLTAGFGGVELTRPDGSTETFPEAESVDEVPNEAWERAVTFRPLADTQRRQFRSTAGSGTTVEFEPTTYGSTVVTTVADPNADPPMRGVGAGSCGDADVATIEVRVDAEGVVHQSTVCTDGTPP